MISSVWETRASRETSVCEDVPGNKGRPEKQGQIHGGEGWGADEVIARGTGGGRAVGRPAHGTHLTGLHHPKGMPTPPTPPSKLTLSPTPTIFCPSLASALFLLCPSLKLSLPGPIKTQGGLMLENSNVVDVESVLYEPKAQVYRKINQMIHGRRTNSA